MILNITCIYSPFSASMESFEVSGILGSVLDVSYEVEISSTSPTDHIEPPQPLTSTPRKTSSGVGQTCIHKCKLCDFATPNRMTLSRHRNAKHGGMSFCSDCHKNFTSKYDLNQHMVTKHGDGTQPAYMCHTCGITLQSRSGLLRHCKSQHLNQFNYTCGECGRKFRERHQYMAHVNNHVSVQPYVCSKCPMRFNRKDNKDGHEKICGDQQKSKCPHCENIFTRIHNLKEHVRNVHTDDTSLYACPRGCGAKYKWKKSLDRHQRQCKE